MKIDVFVSDTPELRYIADALTRALVALGHDAAEFSYPTHSRDGTHLMFEIGTRTVGCNTGCPVVHWVIDPIGANPIPGDWIASYLKGHLFIFADHESHKRAHQQSIRTAEYIPLGWDSIMPYEPKPKVEEYQVGYFGDPTPEIIDVLWQIKGAKKDWKFALWGPEEAWKSSPWSESWVGDLPSESMELLPLMDKCRYVLDDPRHTRPGFYFMTACASQAVALAPFTRDRYDCFDWSRCLYAPGYAQSCIDSIDRDQEYRDVKQHQLKAVGLKEQALWTKVTDMYPAAFRHNRMIDRALYILSIMETKSLFDVAKKSCKDSTVVKMQVDEKWAYINLNYPYKDDVRQFDFVFDDKLKAEQIPIMLRMAARRIEAMILDGVSQAQVAQSGPGGESAAK